MAGFMEQVHQEYAVEAVGQKKNYNAHNSKKIHENTAIFLKIAKIETSIL